MIKVIYVLLVVAILAGGVKFFLALESSPETIMCTMDAMMCPDGSSVGRSGPNCEFICPPTTEVPSDVQAHINSRADLIVIDEPSLNSVVMSPLIITGKARGPWYFEGSFPVVLTNWDGLIIAQGVATAEGEWMTDEFVPFSATLEFTNPYNEGDQDFMKRGVLILQKDNPSGLPEKDDALEIPIRFTP